MAEPGAPVKRRRGRPPGRRDTEGGTRKAILDAALAEFAAHGYTGASMRAIARAAGVDPALVHHYFGSKDRVFAEAMDLPLDPGAMVARIFGGGRAGAGERLVREFFTIWEDPGNRDRLITMLRTAMPGGPGGPGGPDGSDGSDGPGGRFREFITAELAARLTAELEDVDAADAGLRAGLCMSHVLGLGFTRYVLCVEPIASADVDAVVTRVAPVIQSYIDG